MDFYKRGEEINMNRERKREMFYKINTRDFIVEYNSWCVLSVVVGIEWNRFYFYFIFCECRWKLCASVTGKCENMCVCVCVCSELAIYNWHTEWDSSHVINSIDSKRNDPQIAAAVISLVLFYEFKGCFSFFFSFCWLVSSFLLVDH